MTHGTVRAAIVAAGAATLLAAGVAEAQRPLPRVVAPPSASGPRVGRAAQGPTRQVPDPRFPQVGTDSRFDPRFQQPGGQFDGRRRRPVHNGASTVVVVPGYGYGYDYGAYGSYGYGTYGYAPVYDVNGRPLATRFEPEPPVSGYAYTPDLSGSPYAITDEGMMVVDFSDRPRRAFPSCAGQSSMKDPKGRPRTIFYQPSDYWMVLRPGQRGRVQGEPPNDAQACYAIDSVGRVVLRYGAAQPARQ